MEELTVRELIEKLSQLDGNKTIHFVTCNKENNCGALHTVTIEDVNERWYNEHVSYNLNFK